MTIVVTPPIGSKGRFSLGTPFDRFVDEGVEYACMAVRKLSDYIAANERPDELIYKTYGIEDQYDADMKADTYIVSLQSRRGHWLYVPAQYVLGYPSGSGHRYRSISLVFALPPIPVDVSLDTLQADIISTIRAQLGVTAKSKPVETSLTSLVSDEKHIEVSTGRSLEKTSNGSWEELHVLRETNRALRTKLEAVETYLLSIGTPAP